MSHHVTMVFGCWTGSIAATEVEYEVLSEDAQTLLRETLKLDNP